jgi:hypothetical protein
VDELYLVQLTGRVEGGDELTALIDLPRGFRDFDVAFACRKKAASSGLI